MVAEGRALMARPDLGACSSASEWATSGRVVRWRVRAPSVRLDASIDDAVRAALASSGAVAYQLDKVTFRATRATRGEFAMGPMWVRVARGRLAGFSVDELASVPAADAVRREFFGGIDDAGPWTPEPVFTWGPMVAEVKG